MEVEWVSKHTVCNFSCKCLWRMAVTHYREPRQVIVAGRTRGKGSKHKLQGQCLIAAERERWSDGREGGMSERAMEVKIKQPSE